MGFLPVAFDARGGKPCGRDRCAGGVVVFHRRTFSFTRSHGSAASFLMEAAFDQFVTMNQPFTQSLLLSAEKPVFLTHIPTV